MATPNDEEPMAFLDSLAADPHAATARRCNQLCHLAQAAYAFRIADRQRALFAVGCRSWSCPQCGPVKRRQLVKQIVKAKPNRMLTLTCRHEHGPAYQLHNISKALPRLISELRRRLGATIEYFRMLEFCQDGYPHFHLLLRTSYLPHEMIREIWEKNTTARIVDIRVAHGKSTSYVSKYLTKARNAEGTFIRQHISVSSRFWNDDDAAESQWLDWTMPKLPIFEEAENVAKRWSLERINPGVYIIVDRRPGDELPVELQPAHWNPEVPE